MLVYGFKVMELRELNIAFAFCMVGAVNSKAAIPPLCLILRVSL